MGLVIGSSYGLLDACSTGQFHRWVFAWTAGHGIDLTRGVIALRDVVFFLSFMGFFPVFFSIARRALVRADLLVTLDAVAFAGVMLPRK